MKNSSLKMQLLTAPNQSRTQQAFVVTNTTDWTESATWNTRDGVTAWASAGGDTNAAPAASTATGTTANVQKTWPILSDGTLSNIPQFWLDNPSDNQGLLIRDATEDDPSRAVLNKVLSGTVTLCNTQTCTTVVTFPGGQTVVTSRSFLMFQVRSSCARPQCGLIRGELTASNQITFTRNSNENSTVNIQWYVVEFSQGVTVTHGSTTQSGTLINIAIPAITGVNSTSQMFVLTSKTANSADNQFNNDDQIAAEMTTTTNLQIRASGSSIQHTIAYQVVAFENALDINVQTGTCPVFTSGAPNVTTTQTFATLATPVDPTKTFVLLGGTSSGAGNDMGDRVMQAELASGTPPGSGACGATCDTLLVKRTITGNDDMDEIFYQVVELRNGSRVGGGVAVLTGFTAQSVLTPSEIDGFTVSRSTAHVSTQSAGGGQNLGRTAFSAGQGLGEASFTLGLSSPAPPAVNLTIDRNLSTSTSVLGWFVTEWNNALPDEVHYGSREDGTASNRPTLDVSFLRNVALSSTTAGISEISFTWTYPGGTDRSNYNGVTIVRTQGGTAPTFVPTDGTAYTVGQTVAPGEFVAAQTSEPSNSGAFTIFTVTDENGPDNVILPSTQYSFKLFNRDAVNSSALVTPPTAAPRYASGISTTVTTAAAGGANKLWSYKTGATTLAPPGLDPGNSIITGSNDNIVHSMSAADGGRRYQPGGVIGITGGAIQSRPPVIAAADTTGVDCDKITGGVQTCDIVFVGAGDGKVYAFNASTGAKIWESAVLALGGGTIQGGLAVQLKAFSNGAFTSTVDLVYVGTRNAGGGSTTNNRVYALNADTGAIVWTFNSGGGSAVDLINSTPVVDYTGNTIWVTSLSNSGTQDSLWQLNSNTGALIASHNLGDIDGSPSLNLDGKMVYAVTNAGALAAVRTDIASCSTTLAAGTGAGFGFPLPLQTGTGVNEVFFSTATTVNKFSVTYNPSAVACGSEVLTNLNGGTWTNPTISNPSVPTIDFLGATKFLYVGDSAGRINKIHPTTGVIAATRDVNLGATIGDPSIDLVLSRLLVGDTAGRIYAFDVF
jgi:outer membrane protein assembly factor BamB